jgi:hypothetical protein
MSSGARKDYKGKEADVKTFLTIVGGLALGGLTVTIVIAICGYV